MGEIKSKKLKLLGRSVWGEVGVGWGRPHPVGSLEHSKVCTLGVCATLDTYIFYSSLVEF
jgi:hypothetical protein